MKILIWGDLSNPHTAKMCQWLADHDVDILPVGGQDPALIKYKIGMFKPDIIHALGSVKEQAAGLGFAHVITGAHAPKCVDTSKFKHGYSPFRRVFQETPDTKIVLIPGIMNESGHYDTILKAVALIIKDFPDINVVFHNPGEDLGYQEQMITLTEELKLSGHTFSNGNVQYVRMPQIYNAADVVIKIPALELLSCAILEALACEIPVISSQNETNNRILPAAQCLGYLDHYVELSEILKTVLNSHEPATSGRELVHELYEQDMWMKLMLENYEMEMQK